MFFTNDNTNGLFTGAQLDLMNKAHAILLERMMDDETSDSPTYLDNLAQKEKSSADIVNNNYTGENDTLESLTK